MPSDIENLVQSYIHAFAPAYKREIRDYFHILRKSIFRERIEKGD